MPLLLVWSMMAGGGKTKLLLVLTGALTFMSAAIAGSAAIASEAWPQP